MSSDQIAPPTATALSPAAADGHVDPADRARRYATERSVVIPDLRVLYLPVPKAGCTSILWLLADLAGLDRERFLRSTTREVTLPMTVHDLWMWGLDGLRLSDLSDSDRAAAFASDTWFRFTVVREPASRLWSAWQSKLLMREPRFVETYGGEPWFPALPSADAPERVIDDFRAFVAGIGDRWAEEFIRDPHWTPQSDIVTSLPLNHVGRLERLGDTIDALRAHVGDRPEFDVPRPRENRTPVRYDPVVYDAASASVVRDIYGGDFTQFGYSTDVPYDDEPARETWLADAVAGFDVIVEAAARHDRLAALAVVVRDRTDEVRSLKADVRERIAEVRRLEKQAAADAKTIADREAKLTRVTGQRDAAIAERNDARAELKRVYASTSWKATEPLRRLTALFRRR